MRTSFAAASLLALAHADSRNMFAPAPAYAPTMTYGQMQIAEALPYGQPMEMAYVQPMEQAYVQPVEQVYAAEESDSSLLYATGALFLVGAVGAVVARGEQRVAEPDLEAATGAVRVAMLFSSGRSSGNKKKAAGKKPAAKGGLFGGGAKKAPARGRAAPAVDDSDLFVHEGTNGFQGDELAFVYRAGLAQ